MKVLVTGGAGFIGSHICDKLLNEGHFVVVIDNLSTGYKENIQHLLNNENFVFLQEDITDPVMLDEKIKKYNIEKICHQAALGSVPRSLDTPDKTHDNNVNGFFNILNVARQNNIKRVVYASSSSVYGTNQNLPKVEDNIGKPLSPYAASKYIDEVYAEVFSRCYQMECIGLRYFNIFGPRQSPNGPYAAVIPRFIEALTKDESPLIYGDGTYSRDFTYVENAVSANILALTTNNENAYGQAFNIGCGGRITINELYNEISKALKKENIKPTYKENRKGDVPHSHASITKASEILEYKLITNFEEGIKKLI